MGYFGELSFSNTPIGYKGRPIETISKALEQAHQTHIQNEEATDKMTLLLNQVQVSNKNNPIKVEAIDKLKQDLDFVNKTGAYSVAGDLIKKAYRNIISNDMLNAATSDYKTMQENIKEISESKMPDRYKEDKLRQIRMNDMQLMKTSEGLIKNRYTPVQTREYIDINTKIADKLNLLKEDMKESLGGGDAISIDQARIMAKQWYPDDPDQQENVAKQISTIWSSKVKTGVKEITKERYNALISFLIDTDPQIQDQLKYEAGLEVRNQILRLDNNGEYVYDITVPKINSILYTAPIEIKDKYDIERRNKQILLKEAAKEILNKLSNNPKAQEEILAYYKYLIDTDHFNDLGDILKHKEITKDSKEDYRFKTIIDNYETASQVSTYLSQSSLVGDFTPDVKNPIGTTIGTDINNYFATTDHTTIGKIFAEDYLGKVKDTNFISDVYSLIGMPQDEVQRINFNANQAQANLNNAYTAKSGMFKGKDKREAIILHSKIATIIKRAEAEIENTKFKTDMLEAVINDFKTKHGNVPNKQVDDVTTSMETGNPKDLMTLKYSPKRLYELSSIVRELQAIDSKAVQEYIEKYAHNKEALILIPTSKGNERITLNTTKEGDSYPYIRSATGSKYTKNISNSKLVGVTFINNDLATVWEVSNSVNVNPTSTVATPKSSTELVISTQKLTNSDVQALSIVDIKSGKTSRRLYNLYAALKRLSENKKNPYMTIFSREDGTVVKASLNQIDKSLITIYYYDGAKKKSYFTEHASLQDLEELLNGVPLK